MYWIFGVKTVDLGDSYTVGGDPGMNIIIARVPVLNVPERGFHCKIFNDLYQIRHTKWCNSLLVCHNIIIESRILDDLYQISSSPCQ